MRILIILVSIYYTLQRNDINCNTEIIYKKKTLYYILLSQNNSTQPKVHDYNARSQMFSIMSAEKYDDKDNIVMTGLICTESSPLKYTFF